MSAVPFWATCKFTPLWKVDKFATFIPRTIPTLEKLADSNLKKYKNFVMWKKCSCIYEWDEVYAENTAGICQINHCSYVPFSRHPQPRFRELLRKVPLSKGKHALRPFKQFCYQYVGYIRCICRYWICWYKNPQDYTSLQCIKKGCRICRT